MFVLPIYRFLSFFDLFHHFSRLCIVLAYAGVDTMLFLRSALDVSVVGFPISVGKRWDNEFEKVAKCLDSRLNVGWNLKPAWGVATHFLSWLDRCSYG